MPYDECSFSVSFSGKSRLAFTQGEDRSLDVTLRNAANYTAMPMDGAQASLHLPRLGGGTVKRRTAPLQGTFDLSASIVMTNFVIPGHGFVTHDLVVLGLIAGGALPAPLSTTVTYEVVVQSDDEFGLLTPDGHPVTLDGSISQVTMSIALAQLPVVDQAAGLVTFLLTANVTANVAGGRGQPIQLNYTDPTGLTRIYVEAHGLDVTPQPLP